MTFDDFLPYILPWAKGCPEVTAVFNARLAATELCRKALIWREYQDAILTVAGQTGYEFEPSEQRQHVVKLLSGTLGGLPVEVVDAQTGKLRDEAGYSNNYAYGTFSGFELRPVPVAGLSIITYSAVVPSGDTKNLPDSFERYAEAIAHGALSRILMAKGKDYSDPAGAIENKMAWDEDIADAKTDADQGFARTTQRTGKVWF